MRGVGSFFALGIQPILNGFDHLLFLFTLMTVESAIALSIAHVAVENLFVVEGGTSRRWVLALVFGLVHGCARQS